MITLMRPVHRLPRIAAASVASAALFLSLLSVAPLAAAPTAVAATATAGSPSGGSPGYWLVASDGGIFTYGGVPFEGSAGALSLRQPIVAMAATPDEKGYWLVASDGGIFAYGDAGYSGSTPALPAASRPTAPIVGMAATPTGHGYWEVAANGSVYAFGDAGFYGSEGGRRLVKPIVGITATPDGTGYWLVASDGGIFAFGSAAFFGSAGAIALVRPIVGMAATPDGAGYWLVASDGGIFAYGTAAFHGSTGAITLNQPIKGMAASPDGGGYWMVAADGGIFSFGDALFRGSAGGVHLAKPVVGMAAGVSLNPYTPGSTGYDISWPQCGGSYPSAPFAFAIVGVNGGRAYTHNPCLASEREWGQQALLSVYVNLDAPPPNDPHALAGPAGNCTGNDTGCMAYNYGYNSALDAYAYGTSQGANASVWWLDVETANTWDSNQFNNARTVQGALDALGASGVLAGIYSTPYQWNIIVGAYSPGVPIWVATGADFAAAVSSCSPSHAFGGGHIWLTQYGDTSGFDRDYACAA